MIDKITTSVSMIFLLTWTMDNIKSPKVTHRKPNIPLTENIERSEDISCTVPLNNPEKPSPLQS